MTASLSHYFPQKPLTSNVLHFVGIVKIATRATLSSQSTCNISAVRESGLLFRTANGTSHLYRNLEADGKQTSRRLHGLFSDPGNQRPVVTFVTHGSCKTPDRAVNSRDNQIKMKITGPERYKLSFDAAKFAVTCGRGTPKFSGLATSKRPKLYIVSVDGNPIYVGITRQSMRNRIRLGFSATGETGYHGYAWRHNYTQAILDIWCHEDAPDI